MVHVSVDHVVYDMSGEHRPAVNVEPLDELSIDTHDCFTGQVTTDKDKFSQVGWEKINPATGPIAVTGAKPGDVLKVNIEGISVSSHGVMVTAPGFGVLSDESIQEMTKIVPIEQSHAIFNENLKVPIRPMIGVIGTTLPDRSVPCGTPGPHGGNMDCKEITAGSRVYLPVNHDGGLLSLGDLHAVMADGEVSMTGLEVSGRVYLTADILSQKAYDLPLPLVSNNNHLMIIHSEETLDEAVKLGTSKAVGFLTRHGNLSKEDALSLISLIGDIKICQVVNPLMTIRIELPWDYLNQLGISEEQL